MNYEGGTDTNSNQSVRVLRKHARSKCVIGCALTACGLLQDAQLNLIQYYFSQVKAVSVRQACVKWAHQFDISQVKGLGSKSKLLLIEEMKEESKYIVSINDVINVWCTTALIRNKLGIVDFVETEQIASARL